MRKQPAGFTLIELAIVLVITGLLLGTGMAAVTNFLARAQLAEAEQQLQLIQAALIGYTISQGRLPCPDTDGYAGNPGTPDGLGNPPAPGPGEDCDDSADFSGYLPWVELGVIGRDPWGTLYYYRVDNEYANDPVANVTFSLTQTEGNIDVEDGAGTAVAENIVALFFSVGPNQHDTLGEASDDEDENLDDNGIFVDKDYVPANATNAAAEEFDDIMHWISSFGLKSKMVDAERLPE